VTASEPSAPIGVFDSGIGGLTVARELMRQLPNESIIYFGDTARVPYGPKSPETVRRYSHEITSFLLGQGVKAVVVACNTATAHALPMLRAELPVPVVGVVEPGARAAVRASTNGEIGVIGTVGTVSSRAYDRAIHQLAPHAHVRARACPLFVPLAEEGWTEGPIARLAAETYLASLARSGIDTLVLGCTHYPLLKPLLRKVVADRAELVDSADVTAAKAAALLEALDLENRSEALPRHQVFVTDVPQRFREVGDRFLGAPLTDVQVISLDEAGV